MNKDGQVWPHRLLHNSWVCTTSTKGWTSRLERLTIEWNTFSSYHSSELRGLRFGKAKAVQEWAKIGKYVCYHRGLHLARRVSASVVSMARSLKILLIDLLHLVDEIVTQTIVNKAMRIPHYPVLKMNYQHWSLNCLWKWQNNQLKG